MGGGFDFMRASLSFTERTAPPPAAVADSPENEDEAGAEVDSAVADSATGAGASFTGSVAAGAGAATTGAGSGEVICVVAAVVAVMEGRRGGAIVCSVL
jgi:hypothetical protein